MTVVIGIIASVLSIVASIASIVAYAKADKVEKYVNQVLKNNEIEESIIAQAAGDVDIRVPKK